MSVLCVFGGSSSSLAHGVNVADDGDLDLILVNGRPFGDLDLVLVNERPFANPAGERESPSRSKLRLISDATTLNERTHRKRDMLSERR